MFKISRLKSDRNVGLHMKLYSLPLRLHYTVSRKPYGSGRVSARSGSALVSHGGSALVSAWWVWACQSAVGLRLSVRGGSALVCVR